MPLVADYVTTGPRPIVAGSSVQFQWNPIKNGEFWYLTTQTVSMIVKNPNGSETTYAGSLVNGIPTSPVIVFAGAIAGTWLRSWKILDGITPYYTEATGFNVVAPA